MHEKNKKRKKKKKKRTVPTTEDVGNQSKSHQFVYGFLNRSKTHEQPPWKLEGVMLEPECRAAWEEEWRWLMSLLQWCFAPPMEYGIFQKKLVFQFLSSPFPLIPCFLQPSSSWITFWTLPSFSSAPSDHSLQLFQSLSLNPSKMNCPWTKNNKKETSPFQNWKSPQIFTREPPSSSLVCFIFLSLGIGPFHIRPLSSLLSSHLFALTSATTFTVLGSANTLSSQPPPWQGGGLLGHASHATCSSRNRPLLQKWNVQLAPG